jgi:hypothetical protein
MVGPKTMVTKKVACPNRECKQSFNVERFGIKNKTINDKCPFCQTKVRVTFD